MDWTPIATPLGRNPATLYDSYMAATRKARGMVGIPTGANERGAQTESPAPGGGENGEGTLEGSAGDSRGGERFLLTPWVGGCEIGEA